MCSRIVGRYRKNISTFFTRLAHGFGRKQRPATVPPSVSPPVSPVPQTNPSTIFYINSSDRSPAPQTGLRTSSRVNFFCRMLIYSTSFSVFELPDELILCILSQISPDPQLTRHYACFCIPYKRICNFHGQRTQSLRQLSMTCWAMRLRFLPWVWENIVLSWQSSEETFVNNLNTVANALHADKYVATSVKYFYTFPYPWLGTDPCLMKVHDGVFHVGFYHVLSVR